MQATRLTSGPNADLNAFFEGGLVPGNVYEFCGEAGAGKTLISLLFSLSVQLRHGFNAKALYISTVNTIPTSRLEKLCNHFKTFYGLQMPSNPMNNILVEHCPSIDALPWCLNVYAETLVREYNVKLVILDDVAYPFRSNFWTDYEFKLMELQHIGLSLRHIANLGAVVVVINEISMNKPALGPNWEPFIDFRYLMAFFNRDCDNPNNNERIIQLNLPNTVQYRGFRYYIEDNGIASLLG